jgi:CRP-like cAMP-binding protein
MKSQFRPPSDEAKNRSELSLGALRINALFSALHDNDITPFLLAAKIRSFPKNKLIYVQGQTGDYFYIVLEGWLKLYRTMPEGEEVIVDMVSHSQTFGESAIFENDFHMCTAEVVESCKLISIPAHTLREQIAINPRLAMNMLTVMSRHHRHHYGALAFNAMLSAPQRVALFLLRLCDVGLAETQTFYLPYDKSLIADTLGMKGATFSRALNILRRKAGISVHDRSVQMESIQQLAEYVYGKNLGPYHPDKV